MGVRFSRGIVFFLSSLLLLACSKKTPTHTLAVDTSLSCLALVTNGPTFAPNQAVTINVIATNGTAPYSVAGVTGTFASSTTLSRAYNNVTSRQIIVNDQVSLSDSAGNSASCSFSVNVAPAVSNPPSLSCQMVGTPENALIGQNVSFAITASGTGTMTFSNFQGGDSSTVIAPLNFSGNVATATVSYATAGTKLASVIVADSNGNLATCNDSTVVNPVAAVGLSASPASSAPVGSSITLTMTPSGFSTAPIYSFYTTEPGVSVTPVTANTARVDATDNLPHAGFNVQVLAYGGAQTATNAVSLAFTQASALSCNISYAAGTYKVGDTVGVNVVASTNEALDITYFSSPDATVLESFAAFPKLLQYSTAGTKYFYALAKSTATGQLCNGGALLQASIQILPNASTPSCTVVTSPNPTYAGTYFNVFVTPSNANGYQRIYLVNAADAATGVGAYGQWHYGATALSAQAVMYVPGTYNVTVTILDELNNSTSSCVTQQQIY